MHQYLIPHKLIEALATIPNVPDAVPPTQETLRAILQEQPQRVDAALALASQLIVIEQTPEAIELLEKVIQEADSAPARANLGTALLLENRITEAVVELSKAVLMDSTLVVAHIQLSRAQRALGDSNAAQASLEKALAFQPKNGELLCELAALYSENQPQRAQELYEAALSLDSGCEPAQIALGRTVVLEGVRQCRAGDFVGASACWAEAYGRFPRVFSADAFVQQQRKDVIESLRASGELTRVRRALLEQIEAGSRDCSERTYRYVLLFLFTEGLIPECYHAWEEVRRLEQYWQSQVSAEKVFPYAHYRLGLARAYMGDFAGAHAEVSFARDYLPNSKHRSLRIDSVLSFLSETQELLRGSARAVPDGSSAETWEQHGFTDQFSQTAWRATGCAPAEAAKWRAAGVRPAQVQEWRQESVAVDDALEWLWAGIGEASEARRWLRAGIAPTVAAKWRTLFPEDAPRAIQCIQLGFLDPEEAKQWLGVFLFPYEAIAWRELGFAPQEAKIWMRAGIKDPFIAKQQRDEEEAVYAAARAEQEQGE